MFGFVVANQALLSPDQIERYRAVYCGLCRAIGQRHGQTARVCLAYDITFLVLLLDSLEEPPQRTGSRGCLLHPVGRKDWRQTRWTDYGADMNVALAYYNCLDDWRDDRSVPRRAFAHLLRPAFERVQEQWPEQCRQIQSALDELDALERARSADLDRVSGCFGRLMAGLFSVSEGYWRDTLSLLGDRLGRFIYLMDAVLDEPRDQKKGRYNPVTLFRQANGPFEALPTLELLIGECASAFETLPLEQDLDLLRNILYSGVWSQWVREKRRGQPRSSAE